VDDMAAACVFLMERLDKIFYEQPKWLSDSSDHQYWLRRRRYNPAIGRPVAGVIGFSGNVMWDADRPDGTPRKLLDVSRISELGWKREVSLEEGLRTTYEDYIKGPHADFDAATGKSNPTGSSIEPQIPASSLSGPTL